MLIPQPVPPTPTTVGRTTPLVSLVLAAICILLYAYTSMRFALEPSASELHVIGGLSEGALRVGNWWSVGMHQLLHLDLEHLLGNLFLLLVIGILVEVAWGWGITALVVGAAALGSTVGTLIANPEYVAVGVSGIIAGLGGFALVQHAPPRANRWALQLVALAVILVEGLPPLLMNDDGDGVDHGGHLGGLIAGVVVALVLRPRRMRSPGALVVARRIGVTLVALLAAGTIIGAAPRVLDVNRYAWHGVGMNPDRGDVTPVPLVELALDGIALDGTDLLLDPDCSVDPDDTDQLSCSARVVDDDDDRRRNFAVDRDVDHLDFSAEFD